VLFIGEQNRLGMQQQQEGGGLNSGKSSSRIEYVVETLLTLSKPKGSKEEPDGKWPATLKIEKNRHGRGFGHAIDLWWHPGLQKFWER
jgi:hypothetical protein